MFENMSPERRRNYRDDDTNFLVLAVVISILLMAGFTSSARCGEGGATADTETTDGR